MSRQILNSVESKTDRRGREAEARFERILLSLTETLPIHGARHASFKEDQRGIDFVVTLFDANGRTTKVPVQVKSSKGSVHKYMDKYPEYIKLGIVIVVVNGHKSDEEIREEINLKFQDIIDRGVDFRPLFRIIHGAQNSISREREEIRKKIQETQKSRRRHTPEFFFLNTCRGVHQIHLFRKLHEDVPQNGFIRYAKR